MKHLLRIAYLLTVTAAFSFWGCNTQQADVLPPSYDQMEAHDDLMAMAVSDTVVEFNVLANDVWRQECSLTITQPQHGTAQLMPGTAMVKYRPHAGFSGRDSLRYTLSYKDKVAAAWLKIAVGNGPCQLRAHNDVAVTEQNNAVTVQVLQNDTVCPTFVLAIAQQPGSGSAQVIGNSVKYTPQAGFTGNDSFDYSLCTAGGCVQARVSVTVNPNNCGAIFQARPDTIEVRAGQALQIAKQQLLANDVACANDINPASFTLVSGLSAPDILQETGTDLIIHAYSPAGTRKTFSYSICSRNSRNVCSTGIVTVKIK